MVRHRGFTLIELAIVIAMVGILATLAYASMRAGQRNATANNVAFELQMRIEQLQFAALSEQTEHVLIVADAPGNDFSGCGAILTAGCARAFDVQGPTTTWRLSSFDVDAPGNEVARVVDELRLDRGVKLYLGATTATLPAPFNAFAATFKTFDPDLTAICPGNRRCVAYRFRTNGQVQVEPPDPASPPATAKSGHAFALGTDLTGQTRGAQQIGVLVAVPSGIVRTFDVP
ncbi:MAG TPA: prepilin-type N-terminal cleavage/methylation domain-containing protein [Anaeromyxobacter sp.]